MAQAGLGHAIDWIADDNPRKVGSYLPGSGIPVVPSVRVGPDAADYCVLFAWNFRADILSRTGEYSQAGGRYLVPFPEVTII